MNIRMKKIVLLSTGILLSFSAFAQDIITKRDGKRINAIVTEITDRLVRYKYFSDQKGKGTFLYRDMVSSILYEDGTIDRFDEAGNILDDSEKTVSAPKQTTTTSSSLQSETPVYSTQKEKPVVKLSSDEKVAGFSGFQIHGGLFLPNGKFGDYGIANNSEFGFDGGRGNAATGFNVGIKYYSPIVSVSNLSWFAGADILYNDLQTKFKDKIEEFEESESDVTYPRYLNIPILVGLNYSYPLNTTTSLYGEFGLGLNFSKLTNLSYNIDDTDGFSAKFDLATGVAFALEAGVLLNSKFSIGLRYYGLGSYKYGGRVEWADGDGGEDFEFPKTLPVSGLALTVGYFF
jgi:hypothetical protein